MDLLLVDIPNSSLRTISVTLTLPADLNEFSEVAAAIVFVIIRRYSYVFHMERREIRIVACPHFGVM
ncbi:hypothetical protein AFLA_001999 [Aspergillus flavus NRRL3357]|nr:hypothetical protein AFLA_001999 [Aspergillus flavus NRRL3357]